MKNIKQSGLIILIITLLCFVTTNSLATNTSADSVTTIKDFVSYWNILLFIACMLILVPFLYVGYLKLHTVTDEQLHYHFGGEYTAKEIIKHVEVLEKAFGKKFSKFKRLIELFDKDAEGDLKKHSEIINNTLICIKFNGRNRLTVFWKLSDSMLKVLILLLPLIVATIVYISNIYYGLGGLLMSLIPMVFIVPLILSTFSNFLRISQNIHRKKGNPLPTLSLANLAADALINTHIVRSFDKKSRQHFYYTKIHEYNNEVNAEVGFLSKVYVQTSSEIYGSLKELTIGEKQNTVANNKGSITSIIPGTLLPKKRDKL